MTAGPGATTITILVDNKAQQDLGAEHGLSAWVEVAGRRLLFDTGQGGVLEGNADKLGLDLRGVDILVLSHGHFDHTGGLPLVVGRAPRIAVYAHPAATGPRYTIRDGKTKPIGMPAAAQSALGAVQAGVTWVSRPLTVTASVGITGPIPRLTEYEDTGGPFFVDADGKQRDPISDDLALWVRTTSGLVVLVGCCHAGLVNTLRRALGLSADTRLHAVLGGFHLNAASEARLARTIAELQRLGPDLIVPCHCTGEAAVQSLKQAFGERVVPGAAGAVFQLGVAPAIPNAPSR